MGSKLAALSVELGLGGARGAGLLQALVLPTDSAAEVVTHAQQRSPVGLLLNAPRPNLLRFMPSLLVTTEEIDLMVQWLEEVLRATQ